MSGHPTTQTDSIKAEKARKQQGNLERAQGRKEGQRVNQTKVSWSQDNYIEAFNLRRALDRIDITPL